MRAHTATAKQSETPTRVRVLSQKICIYIYIYIFSPVNLSRVKRMCGYNRTYPCTQRPVPRALYVYIYIARLISEKTRE